MSILEPGDRRARILAALRACEDELDRRNATPAGRLALRIARLRALLTHDRMPRIAAVGRRGTGKSSLLNALAGEALAAIGDVEDTTRAVTARRLMLAGRRVEWLDTPGLRAGSVRTRARDVADALAEVPPDVVLVLSQATEVDAGIDDDLSDAALVLAASRQDGRGPAVLGVVTKADELPPPDVLEPPFADPEKQAHIRHAVGLFARHLLRAGVPVAGVLPVCAYERPVAAGSAERLHWNIPALRARIATLLPSERYLRETCRVPELRRLVAGAMDDLGEAFAQLASAAVAERSSGPLRTSAAVRAELAALQSSLTRLQRGLAPQPARRHAWGEVAQSLARPDGILEWLRRGASGVGAVGAASTIAAARMRALSAANARLLLGGLDDGAFASLFDPRDLEVPGLAAHVEAQTRDR